MIRYGRRDLGQDPLAKITSPDGDGAPPTDHESSDEVQSVLVGALPTDHESSDEDEPALVY